MAKNMTRKGLALGAASALVVTGFSALPANAAGLADNSFVSLAPSTGTAYTTLAGSDYTFSLKGNEASTVTGGNFKFLVNDPSEVIEVTSATTARTLPDFGTSDKFSFANSTNTVTMEDESASSIALSVGDVVSFSAAFESTNSDAGASDGTAVELNKANQGYSVTAVSGNTFSFVTDSTEALALSNDISLEVLTIGGTIEVIREARDTTDKTFVVDTATSSASNESTLVLKSDSAVTRSVDVTSWVDSNGNDEIDSTEYASPTRTVTFKKSTEVSLATSITAPLLGAANVTASVTTTPELNGLQVLAVDANALAVGFTEQGTVGTNYDATATWDSTNKEFDFSLALNDGGTNALSQTGADFSGSGTAIAGTYSATGYLIAVSTKSATVSAVTAASVVDDLKATIAGSANITPGANETEASPTTVTVRKDTTTVVVEVAAFDSDGDAVGAGIDVTGTFSSVTGTHKVNGTTAADSGTKTALTDANGVATFTVVSSTAANSDSLTIDFQGQDESTSAKRAEFVINWATATYEIFDLNDEGTAFGGTHNINRSFNKGGSYTFDFAVLDQWGQPIADGHRLRAAATGRTVGTDFVTVTNGRASYTIADGGITTTENGAIALTVTVEEADGSAEAVTVDEFASGENLAFSIDVLDETNVVTLGANGSFGTLSATVDVDDDMSKSDTLRSVDLRTVNEAAPVTGTVLIAGQVDNSVTADPREGAVVTISGDSSFLFQDGDKNSFGSITTLADANGEFAVTIASNKAVSDSVVTVTSNGASKTTKVTFNPAANTEGVEWIVTAPEYAAAGSTFKVEAQLVDKYGNPVAVTANTSSSAGDVRVSYTGAGIVFGNLPESTNSAGVLSFAVLLGSNDSGTSTVTFDYDRNGDEDYTDVTGLTPDFSAAVTVTVGEAPADTKVNAGSFKGYVAVYAKGYEGQRLSAKIGNDWVIVPSIPAATNDLYRLTDFTGAGVDIAVRIYIDRVLMDTINLTTK